MKSSIYTIGLKYGAIMGIGFCLYTTLMWLTKLDTNYLSIGQYLDMAIILLPITILFLAIRQEAFAQKVTLVRRIGIAVAVSAVSYVIYQPYLYVYHNYINPEWFTAVLMLKETTLKSANLPAEEIQGALEKLKLSNASQSGMFRLSTLIPSVIVIPLIIALISVLFIKNRSNATTF